MMFTARFNCCWTWFLPSTCLFKSWVIVHCCTKKSNYCVCVQYTSMLAPAHGAITVNIIYPASEKHISKYSTQKFVMESKVAVPPGIAYMKMILCWQYKHRTEHKTKCRSRCTDVLIWALCQECDHAGCWNLSYLFWKGVAIHSSLACFQYHMGVQCIGKEGKSLSHWIAMTTKPDLNVQICLSSFISCWPKQTGSCLKTPTQRKASCCIWT